MTVLTLDLSAFERRLITPADPPAPQPQPALSALAARIPLDADALRLVWAVCAPHVSPRYRALYRQRWPEGPWPPLAEACHLAADAPEALQAGFSAPGPLRDLALLQRGPDTPGGAAVRPAPELVQVLLGQPVCVPLTLEAARAALPPPCPWPEASQAQLRRALAAPACALRAAPCDGPLAALAHEGPCLIVRWAALPAPRLDALTQAARVACLTGRRLVAQVPADALDALDGWATPHRPLVVVTEPGARPPARWPTVDAPRLPTRTRAALWRQWVSPEAADGLARRHPVGEAAILDAVSTIDPRHPDGLEALDRHLRRRQPDLLGTVGERQRTTLTWADAVLPEAVERALRDLVEFSAQRDTVYADWGMDRLLPYGRGVASLFAGPPGTGKTMMAGVVAQALGLDLLRVDLARIQSKWLGETEKNLARLFDQAERAGVVLFFDEADSLFARRAEPGRGGTQHGNVTVNYLLERMERFDGTSILATNHAGALDPAIRRRLRFVVHFEPPSASERAALWQRMLPPRAPLDDDIDFARLGKRYRLSGGLVKNAVIRAAAKAAAQGRPIDHGLLVAAAEAEQVAQGRLG